MEFLYGVKEGKVYKVAIEKETDKQVKLEANNGTGRAVVKKSDIGRIMGERENAVVFAESEEEVKRLWNAYINDVVIEVYDLYTTLKGWAF